MLFSVSWIQTFKTITLSTVFVGVFLVRGIAQDSDSLTFSSIQRSKLSFILDDTFIIGGINTSGNYYSNLFRNLQCMLGFNLGIEQYIPLRRKVFLSGGLIVSQRNFSYQPKEQRIVPSTLYLDLPLTAAYELPILRNIDLRFYFGAFASLRLSGVVRGNYSAVLEEMPSAFVYRTQDIHRADFGWHFGISAEHKNVIYRIKSQSGFIKFDRKEQGMISSFSAECGYFLFRKHKKQ